jgi:phenol hydroxylase P0 protein
MTLTHPIAPTTADERICDVTRKFVRIKQLRIDGLVCFEFAIGWPELFVDLMLPRSAFDDFCVRQKVQLLSD